MAHQNPWLVREKKSFLKGNIMPPNVNYKPVINKSNNQNTNQSKILGPYPPEFKMMHKVNCCSETEMRICLAT